MKLQLSVCLLILSVPMAASAEIISGNYCSVAHIADYGTGVGAVPAMYWNDFTQPGGFLPTDSAMDPFYSNGSSATGTMIAWTITAGGSQNTNDYIARPLPPNTLGGHIDDGHDQMMAGYLQASKHSTFDPVISLATSNLDLNMIGDTYSVIVYFDGDDDVESDTGSARFELWSSEQSYMNSDPSLMTYYGRDPLAMNYSIENDGTDPQSVYKRIMSNDPQNPTEGNYVRFDNLRGAEFYIRMTGMAGEHGVAMNGFQIVPEPQALILLALGMFYYRRR